MMDCCCNCKYVHNKKNGFWCILEQGYVTGCDFCNCHEYEEKTEEKDGSE